MLRKLLPVLLLVSGLGLGLGAGFLLQPSDAGPDEGHGEAAADPHAEEAGGDHGSAPAEDDAHAESEDMSHGKAEVAHAEGEVDMSHGAEGSDGSHDAGSGEAEPGESSDAPEHDYVKMNNQFIVPVVQKGRVSALVILSLSLEVKPGLGERIYAIEPKLRDALLQVMFDHANSGGFAGSFTDAANLVLLRRALLEAAMRVAGDGVSDVLIVDIVRQDS